MFVRLYAATFCIAASITAGRAEAPARSIEAVTTDVAGQSPSACLAFVHRPAGDADHAGDFLTVEPTVKPSVTVDQHRLCLSGLSYGTHYTVTVHPGLAFDDGSRQTVDETASIDMPDAATMVAVSGRGWIVPRQGATGVTVQTINVRSVRVRVLRLPERRLTATLPSTVRDWVRFEPTKERFRPYEITELLDGQATEIWSGTMRTNSGRNVTVETGFPLAGVIDPSKPGAYLVLAEDAANPADADRQIAGHWVLTTDLALTSLQGQDGLHATVRALGSAAPLAGVRLQLLSRAQDVLSEALTDADGQALFPPGLLRGQAAAAASVLVARTDSDMTVQDLTAPAFDLSDRGAEGRAVPGPLEAYVYTPRGIYRPGETIAVTALLRQHGLSAVDDAGLTFVLRRPDGVEAARVSLPPAPDAGFQQDLKLSATAAQGNWSIEAYVDPSLPPVGRTTISVQDFVPQQLKVTLTGPAAPLTDAHLTAAIDGRFLYGLPAAFLHAEASVRLERDDHPVDAPGYMFGNPNETIPDATQTLQLPDADTAGHVAIDADLTVPDGIASPLRAVLDAGLDEPGGRAVRQTLSVKLRTRPLIGLHSLFGDQLDEGTPAHFAVRAFGRDGVPAHAGLQWRVVRENVHWNWWRGQDGHDGWTFHTFTTEDEVARGSLDVTADRPAELAKSLDWGEYRLTVSEPDSGAASSVKFRVGWGTGSADSETPDRLEVTTDRAIAQVGQTVRVHVRGAFAGTASVIVESAGRMLEQHDVTLPKEGATIDLTAGEAWGAGVHVLAEAFRPLNRPGAPHDPVRAVGLAWVAADPSPHTLSVHLAAPAMVAPRQTVRVPIEVTGAHGRAFVTLAAVDEGILQLTHFTSPDPAGTLLGRTRFALDLRDDYGRLLIGNADVGALREGGDEGAALGGQGLPATSFKVVSLFHGPIELDAQGRAVPPVQLPDFSGELRLMAVAYDHEAAGHAEAPLTVRDPVVADLALPRFLAPGDMAGITLSLDNTDGPAGDYHVTLATDGPIRLPNGLDVHLQQGERRQARLLLAGTGIGIGHVQETVSGPDGLSIAHEAEIAVRSPHADLVLSRTEPQAPGATFRLDPAMLAGFLPGSAHVTIGYSAFGAIDVPGLLQSLYTYPYGCTEQLSSSAFPLLYFNDARLLGRRAGDPAVRARVQAAIDTIEDRQDSAGRFGLWQVGDGAASVWLNIYALDFLLHAREAGFAVPDHVTANAAAWIDQQVRMNRARDDGAYAEPAEPTRAYAAYVLARTDRVDPSRLRALADNLDWSRDGMRVQAASVSWRGIGLAAPLSVAHLAGAESLMGDRARADETFGLAVANLRAEDVPVWWYSAYYYPPLRDEAAVLAVAAETGHDATAAALLERIGRAHLDPEGMNTQEKAWLLAAAHALAVHSGSRMFSVDGAPPASVALPYAIAASADDISRGNTVRNADTATLFRTVTVRGAPASAPPAISSGFSLTRRTWRLDGEPFDDSKTRQTDRFIVELSGSVDNGDFRRAVVIDPLPAGFEIEAPILRPDQYSFLGELTRPRAHEERDDRFVAAFDIGSEVNWRWHEIDDSKLLPLSPSEFRVAYLVRAVTPGHFVRPETVVQDMYRPDIMARTASAATDVAPR